MTALEIYNKVSEWFKTHKPAVSGGSCKYLTPDGRRCAIGCLIPESETSALHHTGGLWGLLKRFEHLKDILLPVDFNEADGKQYLNDMQTAHDCFAYRNEPERLNDDQLERFKDCETIQDYFDHVARIHGVI